MGSADQSSQRAAEPLQSHKPACFHFIPEDEAALLGSLLFLDCFRFLFGGRIRMIYMICRPHDRPSQDVMPTYPLSSTDLLVWLYECDENKLSFCAKTHKRTVSLVVWTCSY